MKKVRIFIKLIAVFMAFVMVFITIPMQAIALNFDETEQTEEKNIQNVDEIEQDVFIVEEDISKRGQFEKHYICSDGTYVSVTYPEAIHYLDDNNKWQDVDQVLSYDSTTGKYTSNKTDFNVSFSNNVSSTNIAQIEQNGYSLSWGIQITKKCETVSSKTTSTQSTRFVNNETELVLVPSSTATAHVEIPTDSKSDNISDRLLSDIDSFTLPNISSQISYTNILDDTQNVSLKYTVYHNKIEEDIIISERGNVQSVSMNMDIGTLDPVVNEDGSVDLVDENNAMQFRIGIPYMMDANFSVCNNIQVTAVKNGTSCVITYTPDDAWYNSSERIFPILLDPSVTTNDYVSNIQDTYVEENSTVNHSSEQYLYTTANGNNQRKAIVRITKLPVIDESMPIISAKLTLTAQYAPLSDVALKANYYDSGLELDEYDYSQITEDLFTYTAYSYLNVGSNTITFDVSSHIFEMYNDEEFDNEHGYNYYGDFIIGYANNGDTTFLFPFFSSENTTPANRPVFTVKYGYTLPAGILDGNVYSFQNYGSYSYMTVNGTTPANNSNIYQVWNDEDIATTTQKFKLEYVASTGGYLLRSMCSSSGSDKVVSIQRGTGKLISGRNVRLYSATDSIAQEWLIVPVDYDVFRIVPRANMSLALTAYGYDDGTNTGRLSTSTGNIFVQTRTDNNSFQQWYIYDDNDNEISTEQFRAAIETGNYFISNNYTGRYLHRTNNVANCMSGKMSVLGEETVKWQIVNLGDGYCTIQRSDTPHYYLAPTSNSSGSGVKFYNNSSETIPENYKWSFIAKGGNKYLIQHKGSGYYLYALNQSANPSSICLYPLYQNNSDGYKKQIWRIENEDNYIELGYGATFNDIAVDINESKSASINKSPSSASWASYTDFDYTITSGEIMLLMTRQPISLLLKVLVLLLLQQYIKQLVCLILSL